MAETRPNFFFMLGLDPKENDEAKIEQQIADKSKEWNSKVNAPPPLGPKVKYYSEFLDLKKHPEDNIKAIMLNAQLRAREAENAQDELAVLYESLDPKIKDTAKLNSAEKPFIMVSQIDILAKNDAFVDRISKAAIEKRIKDLKIPIKQQKERVKPEAPVIGPVLDVVTKR